MLLEGFFLEIPQHCAAAEHISLYFSSISEMGNNVNFFRFIVSPTVSSLFLGNEKGGNAAYGELNAS